MTAHGLVPETFQRLPKDGARFEALVCQLLEAMGYRVIEKPAVGADGGRDILVERTLKDEMMERSERVVVQCKHYAHGGKAVGEGKLGSWQNAMTRKKARGYLLVTDTRVTENVSVAFQQFKDDEANQSKWAAFWDVDMLIPKLNEHPRIRDAFFPPLPKKRTSLEELALEVRTWLQAIRFKVGNIEQINERLISFIALLDKGAIQQRVLVRCIGGEITPNDVEELDNTLDRKTPKGWLICDQRVSLGARQKAAEDKEAFRVFVLSEFLKDMQARAGGAAPRRHRRGQPGGSEQSRPGLPVRHQQAPPEKHHRGENLHFHQGQAFFPMRTRLGDDFNR